MPQIFLKSLLMFVKDYISSHEIPENGVWAPAANTFSKPHAAKPIAATFCHLQLYFLQLFFAANGRCKWSLLVFCSKCPILLHETGCK